LDILSEYLRKINKSMKLSGIIGIVFFLLLFSCNKENKNVGDFQLVFARLGQSSILNQPAVMSDDEIILGFQVSVDNKTTSGITLQNGNLQIPLELSYSDQNKIINIKFSQNLEEGKTYKLNIPASLKAENGAVFKGAEIIFTIVLDALTIRKIEVEGKELHPTNQNAGISGQPVFLVTFSHPVTSEAIENNILLTGKEKYNISTKQLNDTTVEVKTEQILPSFLKVRLFFSGVIGDKTGRPFKATQYTFYTGDNQQKVFPELSDEALLNLVQEKTFEYFWSFGHPVSGMARERNTSGDLVTSGGSGFGLMSMIVATERGWISRNEAVSRWKKIVDFLEKADRFHGVWPHWMNGITGKTIPFSTKDNGGDLVETAFLVQGLITVRQYLNESAPNEKYIIDKINKMWREVEWNFYRNQKNVLYWHWSPQYNWEMNLPISGYNEGLMPYVLAASSPDYSIPTNVYHEGFARNGGIKNGRTFYGFTLPLGYDFGGPLFFAHYSFMGLDPGNLKDNYANYWQQNVNHSKINHAYCAANPKKYVGYSDHCWGLTASDNHKGYNAHSPTNDLGVISPTAALSSFPYTPEESMKAMKFFYYTLGDRIWGQYGFYDAFHLGEGWTASSYLAIDQGPIVCMIENHRTGLLWDLFMSAPEIQSGLTKLGFTY
jgi:hypothetical protein